MMPPGRHDLCRTDREVTKGDFEFVSRWRLRQPSMDVTWTASTWT